MLPLLEYRHGRWRRPSFIVMRQGRFEWSLAIARSPAVTHATCANCDGEVSATTRRTTVDGAWRSVAWSFADEMMVAVPCGALRSCRHPARGAFTHDESESARTDGHATDACGTALRCAAVHLLSRFSAQPLTLAALRCSVTERGHRQHAGLCCRARSTPQDRRHSRSAISDNTTTTE
jgi:hypothetical protein